MLLMDHKRVVIVAGVFAFASSALIWWFALQSAVYAFAAATAVLIAFYTGGMPGLASWLIVSRRLREAPRNLSWDRGLAWMLATSGALVAMWSSTLMEALKVLDIVSLNIPLLYAAAKARCWIVGCCGWSFSRRVVLPRDMLSLQTIEIIWSLVVFAASCVLLAYVAPGLTLACTLAIHLFMRRSLMRFRFADDSYA